MKWPHRLIVNCERKPYLYRYFLLQTNLLGIYFHKFVLSDEAREIHDHPWAFIVIPLWQGYYEHSDNHGTKRRVWPIIGTRFRRATFQHRVELIDNKPAYSLFIRFKRIREWGFWSPIKGFTVWNKWWQENCE